MNSLVVALCRYKIRNCGYHTGITLGVLHFYFHTGNLKAKGHPTVRFDLLCYLKIEDSTLAV
jgi:hypothetical protein